jgi:hypothetical protein
MKIFAYFALIYMIIMLIVFRVHYIIDIFGGFIYALFFYTIVDRNIMKLDKVINYPFTLVNSLINHCQKQP